MNKSYVIRAGRFTPAQKKAYENNWSKYVLPFSEGYIDFDKLFCNTNSVTMEIGFGMGITTAEIAEKNHDKNYLGIEVHRPGIGRLLWEMEQRNISNIRIIEFDAVEVVEKNIRAASLDAIHIFFPDPWPKKKHHKRRLVKRPFTDSLARCLKPGGYLYFVTDWEDYAFQALEEFNAARLLSNAYDSFAPTQEWRPQTKFEKKGIAKDHVIRELYFLRTAGEAANLRGSNVING